MCFIKINVPVLYHLGKEAGLTLPCALVSQPAVRILSWVPLQRAGDHTFFLSPSHVCVSSHRKRRLAQLYRQTACFSLLWQIYSSNYFFHYKYYSHLAAMMQVNTALETQDDFQVGCCCSCFLKSLHLIQRETPTGSQPGFKIRARLFCQGQQLSKHFGPRITLASQ